uniref:Uncharacterized protein n=1 Tax=Rhizophora mucronata TaxID=61149 RepID=A0A2P2J2M6_RHIMU
MYVFSQKSELLNGERDGTVILHKILDFC